MVYDRKSLNIFHHKTFCRKTMVRIVESKNFDNAIVILILMATLLMLLVDYSDSENETEYNQKLELVSSVFVYLFTLECLLKIITQGLVMHENSYLRDSWNWIDFSVVITGILELANIPGVNLRSLRALRVLRPLRSIKAFPSMRKLI